MTQNYALVEQLHLICQELLGRMPTPAELGSWRNRLRGGMTVAQVRTQLARSPEAKLHDLFLSLDPARITPELRAEARKRLTRGTGIEEVAAYVLATKPIGSRPAPSLPPGPGSRAVPGCRTRVPGCA